MQRATLLLAGASALRAPVARRPVPRPRSLEAAYAAGFVDAGAGFNIEATCWTANPLFRIDHVLLNDGLRRACDVADYRRVESAASDHFPVAFDLALRD